MKTLARQEIFNGRIIKVVKDDVELENGRRTTREVVYHHEAVAVVAINENNEILLVKQYRYPIGRELTELPAGVLENGENPLEAAKRELLEETGYSAEHWELLTCIYTSPGVHDEKIYIYSASNLQKISGQNLDEDELLTFETVPFDKVFEMVCTGKIMDAKTIAGVLLYNVKR